MRRAQTLSGQGPSSPPRPSPFPSCPCLLGIFLSVVETNHDPHGRRSGRPTLSFSYSFSSQQRTSVSSTEDTSVSSTEDEEGNQGWNDGSVARDGKSTPLPGLARLQRETRQEGEGGPKVMLEKCRDTYRIGGWVEAMRPRVL